jgi:hypothetical protein
MLWTWLNIKICRFLGIPWEKSPFWSKKGPPKKYIFEKISFFQYFLSPEALSNSSKVQLSQKKKKNSIEKCQKKNCSKFFQTIFFFLNDFLEFLFFFLNLELNPHIHLFFQLSSCTGWFTIKDFPIFQKTAFFAFFWTLPLQLGCVFWQNQPWSPVINCS